MYLFPCPHLYAQPILHATRTLRMRYTNADRQTDRHADPQSTIIPTQTLRPDTIGTFKDHLPNHCHTHTNHPLPPMRTKLMRPSAHIATCFWTRILPGLSGRKCETYAHTQHTRRAGSRDTCPSLRLEPAPIPPYTFHVYAFSPAVHTHNTRPTYT